MRNMNIYINKYNKLSIDESNHESFYVGISKFSD